MITHQYNGWTITKFVGHYLAERNSDGHIAPFNFARLKDAKAAIDNGQAKMTPVEKMCHEYRQQIALGMPVEIIEFRAERLNDKAAQIVVAEYNAA